MTAVVDDPLISRMAISRMLPLHESSRRLRELCPECPRVYGVAGGSQPRTTAGRVPTGQARPIAGTGGSAAGGPGVSARAKGDRALTDRASGRSSHMPAHRFARM